MNIQNVPSLDDIFYRDRVSSAERPKKNEHEYPYFSSLVHTNSLNWTSIQFKKIKKIVTIRLSNDVVQEIDRVFSKNLQYARVSLKELKQLSEIFYKEQINQILYRHFNLIKEKELTEQIRKQLSSNALPLIKLMLFHLKNYQELSLQQESNLSNKHFIKEMQKIIEAILNKDSRFFFLHSGLSDSEFLINALSTLNGRSQSCLSYIVFGNHQDQLKDFIFSLSHFANIETRKIIQDIHTLRHKKIYKKINPPDYRFTTATIIRSFIPDQTLLPNKLIINYLPLNLMQFSGEHLEVARKFFHVFLKELRYLQDEESLHSLLNNFLIDEQLPPDLENVLGVSTVASCLLAFETLDKKFPLLKQNELTYRYDKSIYILYLTLQDQILCKLPLSIILYAKLNPQNPESFSIDKNHPLAAATFMWTSYVNNKGEYTHSTLEFENVNFINSKNQLITEKEINLINLALKLTKENFTTKVKKWFR